MNKYNRENVWYRHHSLSALIAVLKILLYIKDITYIIIQSILKAQVLANGMTVEGQRVGAMKSLH